MGIESFYALIWPALALGLLCSFGLEALVRPKVSLPWHRPISSLAQHAGLWLAVFCFELAVFQRPWFAAAVSLCFQTILVLVNNAKYHSLGEPFIAQDFEYFLDTIRFPRLYLPFFGIGKATLATIGVIMGVGVGLYLESPLTRTLSIASFLSGISLLIIGISLLFIGGTRKRQPFTWNPESDIQTYGFLGSLLPYALAEKIQPQITPPYALSPPPSKAINALPHLVVIQSESFFDPRSWCASIAPNLLAHLDRLKHSSATYGQLQVPAWGANTVRTEFGFLSGIKAEQIGVHRFNPYRKLASWYPCTLVSLLKQLGYRTICIHPYPATFYRRNTIFPQFGFDQFLDIRSFDAAQKSGPYIGDTALAEKICTELTQSSDSPIFIFAITMENHGPLHWEKPLPHEAEQYCTSLLPEGCDDQLIYLRHLVNADTMAGVLSEHLRSLDKEAWLCWYGDHVPIMPTVYKTFGPPDGKTDYLIWSNKTDGSRSEQKEQQVEDLGKVLLKEMNLL